MYHQKKKSTIKKGEYNINYLYNSSLPASLLFVCLFFICYMTTSSLLWPPLAFPLAFVAPETSRRVNQGLQGKRWKERRRLGWGRGGGRMEEGEISVLRTESTRTSEPLALWLSVAFCFSYPSAQLSTGISKTTFFRLPTPVFYKWSLTVESFLFWKNKINNIK